jgi:2-aminobenzoate-CoA ligase
MNEPAARRSRTAGRARSDRMPLSQRIKRQANYVRDGWNLTGDSFIQDDAGIFHFAARSDDMIISAGYNIAGPEVEAALLAHDEVAECAVIGVADEERGQIVQAHVVLTSGVTGDAACIKRLQDHVKQAIAPYKYPRSIIFTIRAAKDPDRQDPAFQASHRRRLSPVFPRT